MATQLESMNVTGQSPMGHDGQAEQESSFDLAAQARERVRAAFEARGIALDEPPPLPYEPNHGIATRASGPRMERVGAAGLGGGGTGEFQRFHTTRRSAVYSTKGMVCCTQPLAARAGIKILEMGGNAAVSLYQVFTGLYMLHFTRSTPDGTFACFLYLSRLD